MHRPIRLLATSCFVLLLAPVLAAPAQAHVHLHSSSPARGETVTAPLEEVRLEFSGAVVTAYTAVTLVGPEGELIDMSGVEPIPETGRRAFRLPVDQLLPPGEYTVRWATMAGDGHRIDGSFSFVLEVPEELMPAERPAVEAPEPEAHPDLVEPRRLRSEGPVAATIRFLHYLSLLLLLGGSAFHFGVIRRMRRDDRVANLADVAIRRNVNLMTAGFVLFVIVVLARLWAQSAQLHGLGAAWDPQSIATLLTVTTWGHGWILQVAAGLLFLGALVLIRRSPRSPGGWGTAAAALLALAVVPALSGHAAAIEELTGVAIAVHAMHVLGAGVWLGSLAVLVVVGLPAAAATHGERMPAVAAVVGLFSPVALAGALFAGATGVANALFHLSAFQDLWTTDYGLTLLVKLAVLAMAFGLGFYHWRVVRPGLHEKPSPRRFSWTARGELVFGLLVLGATAVLAAVPPPA